MSDSNVVDINEARDKKKKKADEKKLKSQTSKNNPGPGHFPYTGKLGEAMAKYGSCTGNVLKDKFKKKEKVGEEDDI